MSRPSAPTRGGERARRGPEVRRRRAVAAGVLGLVSALVVVAVLLATAGPSARPAGRAEPPGTDRVAAASGRSAESRSPPHVAGLSAYAVGLRVVRLLDTSRTIALPGGRSEPRPLVTEIYYPALGAPGSSGGAITPDAPPARAGGPFPLVVFGHGFAVTPKLYAPLLQAWARAGYVVAAPVFPLENAQAPGGPDESDLVNQPADMRFVISRMLSLSQASSGPLAGLIDPAEVAVSGQSDGGDSALAAAYYGPDRDPRVGAAIILSGAEIPALGSFAFPPDGPPLLATQGTADTVNPPSATEAFFTAARRPKYLLRLIGAEHLPPYSTDQTQLAIVERVTIAFLDGYLEHVPSALERLKSAGVAPGTATMLAEP